MELPIIVIIILLMIISLILKGGVEHHHHHYHFKKKKLRLTFFVNNYKIESPMSLQVKFGTPISGFITGLNAAQGPVELSDLQAGSLEFSSSDESVLKVVGDSSTAKFTIDQVVAGTADVLVSAINSKGEAVSGKATITLDPVEPPPPPPDTVVAELVVNFDQATA